MNLYISLPVRSHEVLEVYARENGLTKQEAIIDILKGDDLIKGLNEYNYEFFLQEIDEEIKVTIPVEVREDEEGMKRILEIIRIYYEGDKNEFLSRILYNYLEVYSEWGTDYVENYEEVDSKQYKTYAILSKHTFLSLREYANNHNSTMECALINILSSAYTHDNIVQNNVEVKNSIGVIFHLDELDMGFLNELSCEFLCKKSELINLVLTDFFHDFNLEFAF